MNDDEKNRIFKQIADSFIALANNHTDATDKSLVSSSFLFGASRFAAFVAASKSDTPAQFEASQQAAIDYYTQEFKEMLETNLKEYIKVYSDAPKYEHLMKKD